MFHAYKKSGQSRRSSTLRRSAAGLVAPTAGAKPVALIFSEGNAGAGVGAGERARGRVGALETTGSGAAGCVRQAQLVSRAEDEAVTRETTAVLLVRTALAFSYLVWRRLDVLFRGRGRGLVRGAVDCVNARTPSRHCMRVAPRMQAELLQAEGA